jgi:hypothetical protein
MSSSPQRGVGAPCGSSFGALAVHGESSTNRNGRMLGTLLTLGALVWSLPLCYLVALS